MTNKQGRGVESLVALLNSTLKRLGREEARAYVDGWNDDDLADVLDALAAAEAATGTGNLLYESAAARLRGVDVAQLSSRPGAALECSGPVS